MYMHIYINTYKHRRADRSGGAPKPFSKQSARFTAAALCPCV